MIKAGEDVRVWAARASEAFSRCSALHDDAVRFYQDVRIKFGG